MGRRKLLREGLRTLTNREGTIRMMLVTSFAPPGQGPGAIDLGPAFDQAEQRPYRMQSQRPRFKSPLHCSPVCVGV